MELDSQPLLRDSDGIQERMRRVRILAKKQLPKERKQQWTDVLSTFGIETKVVNEGGLSKEWMVKPRLIF
jgi:hypothetical protein